MASFSCALRMHLTGPRAQIFASFWLLGLINNVLYVIILSAALDLVGPAVPKSLVLLFDVAPSFFVKLVAPYFIHRIGYSRRVLLCALLAATGMALVALSPSTTAPATATTAYAKANINKLLGKTPPPPSAAAVALKMLGIALASLSSGAGELSFLALTSVYGPTSLAAWGSGTGGAGLIGAGAYMVATTTLGLSVRSSLLVFSFLPLVMLAAYFLILPRRIDASAAPQYAPIATEEPSAEDERADLLTPTAKPPPAPPALLSNLRRVRSLILPYMLPLFLVYLAEYTINQGITPTLLYPLKASPFTHYRDFYPAYGFLYQAGVFVSRSSLPFLRVQSLYGPAALQAVNVGLFAAQALTAKVLPNVWVAFGLVFWEGLLGGLVYVSAFRRVGEEVPPEEREFSLAATTVSDSAGILLASFLGMGVETGLCRWQVRHGRDWCTKL